MLSLNSIFELIVNDYIDAVGASLDYRSTNTFTLDLHPKLSNVSKVIQIVIVHHYYRMLHMEKA
jgi:hypothetical protein